MKWNNRHTLQTKFIGFCDGIEPLVKWFVFFHKLFYVYNTVVLHFVFFKIFPWITAYKYVSNGTDENAVVAMLSLRLCPINSWQHISIYFHNRYIRIFTAMFNSWTCAIKQPRDIKPDVP